MASNLTHARFWPSCIDCHQLFRPGQDIVYDEGKMAMCLRCSRAYADRMADENLRQAKAKSLRLQWKMYDAWKPKAML